MIAHVISSEIASKVLGECLSRFGFEITFPPDSSVDRYPERMLGLLERCDVLVVDTDCYSRMEVLGFSVGYCIARGKSVIGLGEARPPLLGLGYLVKDLRAFERVCRVFAEDYQGRP